MHPAVQAPPFFTLTVALFMRRSIISSKEEIIISSPFSFPLLKHIPYKVHRFKGGKIRILYALSPEAPIFWDSLPGLPEIIFLFVDLRSDETYNDALKILKKMVYKD